MFIRARIHTHTHLLQGRARHDEKPETSMNNGVSPTGENWLISLKGSLIENKMERKTVGGQLRKIMGEVGSPHYDLPRSGQAKGLGEQTRSHANQDANAVNASAVHASANANAVVHPFRLAGEERKKLNTSWKRQFSNLQNGSVSPNLAFPQPGSTHHVTGIYHVVEWWGWGEQGLI